MVTRTSAKCSSIDIQDVGAPSPWAPFLVRPFAVPWPAKLVANIGTWMYNAASGWLITSLAPDPLMVSLVQAAATLPMFLLALPAGALADLSNRRRLLIIVNLASTLVGFVFASLVWFGAVTAPTLLIFAFLAG